jgi:UV radiation resistance-associated gene protein
VSERIRHRKERLKCRREALSLATDTLSQDVADEALAEQELSRERCAKSFYVILFCDTVHRELAMALQRRILPIRASLITTLASLFPIDLISGSDLLFSILDAPLPIPLGGTDPAPPLLLPTYKQVNEEGVATALAYAGFVVQLLAAYLDKMLVYPITFCGSRSMIRDGISAMVGPRMCVLSLYNACVD